MKMQKRKWILTAVILFTTMISVLAQSRADQIVGVWLTEDQDARVEIYKTSDKYQGKIIWLLNPNDKKTGKPLLDTENKDAAKRSMPVLGLQIIRDLSFSDGQWKDGSIYDPESGKSYKAKIALADKNTLEMTGYIGMFGSTETWTRVK
ncbi:DUF2147 domain-containing protein [Ohtaekwangia sp.]|uniref:DUF2147 domain-containing protein n=1 Tax=Ohtaekwangia sp. TaxID=2066019 RepID=UPI002F94D87F